MAQFPRDMGGNVISPPSLSLPLPLLVILAKPESLYFAFLPGGATDGLTHPKGRVAHSFAYFAKGWVAVVLALCYLLLLFGGSVGLKRVLKKARDLNRFD